MFVKSAIRIPFSLARVSLGLSSLLLFKLSKLGHLFVYII